MELQSRRKGHTLLLTICEERFDTELASEFVEIIKGWRREGVAQIVLDLHRVDFLDSTSLGVLVSCFKSIREKSRGEGGLSLCHVSNRIMSLLKLTRMDRVLPVYDSCEEALQALEKESQDADGGGDLT